VGLDLIRVRGGLGTAFRLLICHTLSRLGRPRTTATHPSQGSEN